MIITIIGRYKYYDEMIIEADRLKKEGHTVFLPSSPLLDDINGIIINYEKVMEEKIRMSDKVFVFNKGNGYIGKDTKREIDFALSINKVVEYYQDINNYKLIGKEIIDTSNPIIKARERIYKIVGWDIIDDEVILICTNEYNTYNLVKYKDALLI